MADLALRDVLKRVKYLFIALGDIENGAGGWRSSRDDAFGLVMSYERVIAAHAAWSLSGRSITLIPSGGRTNLPGESQHNDPTISSVAKRELQELGVYDQYIIEEPRAYNTLEQIRFCAELALDRGWWHVAELGMLAPSWQIPRIRALIDSLSRTEADSPLESMLPLKNMSLIPMERVLIELDPSRWTPFFRDLEGSPEMRELRNREQRGVTQLLTGYPEPYRGLGDPLDAS